MYEILLWLLLHTLGHKPEPLSLVSGVQAPGQLQMHLLPLSLPTHCSQGWGGEGPAPALPASSWCLPPAPLTLLEVPLTALADILAPPLSKHLPAPSFSVSNT